MLRETFISAIEIVLNRKTKILLCVKPEGTLLCRLSKIEKRIKEQTSKVNMVSERRVPRTSAQPIL
jgi:hypothetical protein